MLRKNLLCTLAVIGCCASGIAIAQTGGSSSGGTGTSGSAGSRNSGSAPGAGMGTPDSNVTTPSTPGNATNSGAGGAMGPGTAGGSSSAPGRVDPQSGMTDDPANRRPLPEGSRLNDPRRGDGATNPGTGTTGR